MTLGQVLALAKSARRSPEARRVLHDALLERYGLAYEDVLARAARIADRNGRPTIVLLAPGRLIAAEASWRAQQEASAWHAREWMREFTPEPFPAHLLETWAATPIYDYRDLMRLTNRSQATEQQIVTVHPSREPSRDPGGGEGGGSGRSRASRAASRGQGEDLEVDYSERAGFLTGKAAAIADWQRKKEATEYDALFKRLYARNWQRLYREQHPEEAREKLRAWRAANPERAREANVRHKRTKRERQLQEMKAEYRVIEGVPRRIYRITCAVCGASAEKLQPNAVWCSKVCANRYHSAPRARARNRGIRNMTIIPTALAHIEITPGLTLKELHARMPDASYGSLATTLTALAKREMVQRVDRPDARGQGYVLGPRAPGRSR